MSLSSPSATCLLPLGQAPEVLYVGQGIFHPPAQQFLLPDLWALHFYQYSCPVRIGGHDLQLHPGDFSLTPAGVSSEYDFQGRSIHAAAHLRLPLVENHPPEHVLETPLVGRFPGDFSHAYEGLLETLTYRHRQAPRAAARLWDLLWTIAARTGTPLADQRPGTHEDAIEYAPDLAHPKLQQAVAYIERHLAEPLPILDLARRVDLSPNHLTRLFRESFGTTAVAFIRARRVDRARHLLEHSARPVKAVAAEVGIPDPHQFNKTIRRELGLSPTEVRQRAR